MDNLPIESLPEKTFLHEMGRANTMRNLDSDNSEYWIGYQRGLRRVYHGENFGTPAEHKLWLESVDSDDTLRKQRGQGYRDGLAGKPKDDKNV